MAETRFSGVRISYDDLGEGDPALLFMPGWCASRAAFTTIVSQTSARQLTLALDFRGHGESGAPVGDFGEHELVEDAKSVLRASGAQRIVPVATAHAGWVAIELRRRLGERIQKLVLVDWIVLTPPPPFLAALKALQDPTQWGAARDGLFSMWLEGVDHSEAIRFVREDMGSYPFEMWARGGREIEAAYARAGSPLQALSELEPPVPVLHVYSQPDDPGYLAAQQAFAETHPWFSVRKLDIRSHFPTIEIPDELTAVIAEFVSSPLSERPARTRAD